MAAGLVIVAALAGQRGAPAAAEQVATAPVVADERRDTTVIQFVFVAPTAASVSLVGDFNGWDRRQTPLTPVASGGMWTVALPLPPGRHRYAFIVDGTRWVLDPSAPRAVEDDFGSPNSVVTVGENIT
jgi:1,4-alpha-glucan branching enzyme